MKNRLKDEDGQTSVLIIGVMVIILLLATVLMAITTVNLEARKLLSVADSAVSQAAQEFNIDNDKTVRLNARQAQEVVQQYLTETSAHQEFSQLQIRSVHVIDGAGTINVELSSQAHPPIVNWIVPEGVPITVHASARTVLER